MLRSKQLLPFAKGARAWIIGGSVSKVNPLDGKPVISGSEDGNSEQGINAISNGIIPKSSLVVPEAEGKHFGPSPKSAGAPMSAAAFNRLRQQSSNRGYSHSSLTRGSGVSTAAIPSRAVLLTSAAENHRKEKFEAPDNADVNGSALVSRQTVAPARNTRLLVAKAEGVGRKDLHEAVSIAQKSNEFGFAAVGHISDCKGTFEQCATAKVKIPNGLGFSVAETSNFDQKKVVESERGFTRNNRACDRNTAGGAQVGLEIHQTSKLSTEAECTSGAVNLMFKPAGPAPKQTIFFGSLDAPVVIPCIRSEISEEETSPTGKNVSLEVTPGSQHQTGKHNHPNPKGERTNVAGGQRQRSYNTKSSGFRGGEVNAGFSGHRKKVGGLRQLGNSHNPNHARREPGWEKASNDMVDEVSTILRRLGWTSQTVDALAHFDRRLGAYHINEVLKHQREPSIAWAFFNWAKRQRGFKHDVLTYTTMIGILGRVKDFEGCNMLLNDMRKEGCEPSVVTFNRLIHSYGRANYLGEALKLFDHMQEVGCQPDRVTYCTLIDLHSKSGYHDIAMDICNKMWEAGFQPDTFSYTLVIHCLGKAGNLPAAYKMFMEMIDRGCTPNLVTYNIMIDLHAKAAKYHMALKLYNDMQDAGHRPDKVTYSVIMEVLGNSGHTDEAEEVFFEMKQEGWTADAPTFGLLVNMWGQDGNVEKASEWYQRMLDSGLLPNVPTINSLLGGYLRAHQYEGASQVLQSLSKWGLTPTLPTYTLLLSSCTTCDDKADVDSVLQLMSGTGHPAHVFLCRLLDVDVKHSKVLVEQFFQGLRLEDQETKRGFADALMEFLFRSDHKAKAGRVWEVAVDNNLYPLAVSQKVPNNWIVDLHVMSRGTAMVALSRTLASLRERMLSTGEVPDRIEIVTGWGKHSRVSGLSLVKNSVQSMLGALGSPFHIENSNVGCFVGSGQPLADWLYQPDMDHMLAL